MATNNFFKGTNSALLDPVEQTAENPSNTSNYPTGTIIWNRTAESFYRLESGSWTAITLSGSNIPLNDVSDVNTSGVTDGQVLGYAASTSTWGPVTVGGGSASALSDLTDVTTVGATGNNILYYDVSTSAWKPQAFSTQETYSSTSDLTTALTGQYAAVSHTHSSSDVTNFGTAVTAAETYSSTSDLETGLGAGSASNGQVLTANGSGSTSWSSVTGDASNVTLEVESTSAYQIVLADVGKLKQMQSTSAITVTVPASSTSSFSTGDIIAFVQGNTGTVTFSPAAGVTIRSKNSNTSMNGRWSTVTLTYLGGDVHLLSGDLV